MKKIILLLLFLTSCIRIEKYYPDVHEYTFNIISNINDVLYSDIYRNGDYYITEICNTDYIYIDSNEDISVLVSNEPLYGISITDHDMIFGIRKFRSDLSMYRWDDYNTNIPIELKPLMYDYSIEVISDIICDSVYVSNLSRYRNLLSGENLSDVYTLGLCFDGVNVVNFRSFGPPNGGS